MMMMIAYWGIRTGINADRFYSE